MIAEPEPRPIKSVRSKWSDIVLVCRKCSKKLSGGFGPGGDQGLAKALRMHVKAAAGSAKGKGRRARVGVIEVGCFDVCPKNAVVAVSGAAPDEWLVIPAGTPIDEAAARLRQATSTPKPST